MIPSVLKFTGSVRGNICTVKAPVLLPNQQRQSLNMVESPYSLSLWLTGTVRAKPETVISRAWVQSPGLGSIPRPGRINCFRITGAHALRLISRTGKRLWRCPL